MKEASLTSHAIEAMIEELAPRLSSPDVVETFANAIRNTLSTTVELRDDGTTFMVTGDIPALWLRDSTGQVLPYLRFCKIDPLLERVVRGLLIEQARCILIDPYANAFCRDEQGTFGCSADEAEQRPRVWERKWELDSLCYHLRLLREFAESGFADMYAQTDVQQGIQLILRTLLVEQDHASSSTYEFHRSVDGYMYHDTSRSHTVGATGMVWSAFRPSDDGCVYNFPVASEMFAAVELGHLARAPISPELQALAERLSREIDNGIKEFGLVLHPFAGTIYAYEVDGMGHALFMDDANVPSLLSAPYIGYCTAEDEIYRNTRKFVLSQGNPYYFHGKLASGVGSPHTPPPYIWPMSLIMEALTSGNARKMRDTIDLLVRLDGGTHFMHESVDPDAPQNYTRSWFAWANALFAELVMRAYGY